MITPAPVTRLVEVASVRTRLGAEASEDSLIAEYIDEICSFLRDASEGFSRELARQQYVETFYPPRTVREIKLSCNPVDTESVSVTINEEAITDFELRDPSAGILYRQIGWPARYRSDEGDAIEVTYKGGFLIPASATAKGVITTWAGSTAYLAGAWARATSQTSALRYECTTAGTSHASTEPTWPTAAGGTVTDGTATWTARTAWELPLTIRQLANIAVKDLRDSALRPAGLASSAGDGFSESYFATVLTSTGISPELIDRLASLRLRWGRC